MSNYVRENPVPVEKIKKVPVEYIVHRINPVPMENVVEVEVPNFNQNTHEKIITKEVLVEVITERPVPIEKIVEKIIEKPTPFDTVIEQKYDVIVQNIVEVPVEKEIRVPVRTISGQPVEQMNNFEKDIAVDLNVTVPAEGREIITDQQVNDPDLDNRINLNRVAFSDITNQNMELRSHLLQVEQELKKAQSHDYNHISHHNANLRAEKSELESRLNITQKDLDRLTRDVENR